MQYNTPINKGNYGMETEEREALFEKYRGEGWEKEYEEYRANWIKYAKEKIVSEYPLLVDLELSSLCNLNCPMCYTITEEFKKTVKTQLMEYDLYCSVIDEIGGKVPAIRLSLRGEATLHPKFVDCIKYAKSKGIKEVSFLTNASRLTEEYFIEVAEAGADWITISVDGMYDTYENIRKPLKFKDTYEKIQRIHEIKKQKGWVRPVIKVQSIWPAIKENPEEFYSTFEPITDYIAFNPIINFNQDDKSYEYLDDFACPQLYQRIVVGSDGKVMMCSNDEDGKYILGDIRESSIFELWHGEKVEYIRKLHRECKFYECDVCRMCYIPRKTDDSEKAYVNGRCITIRNYKE